MRMLELPIKFIDNTEYIIRSDDGFWSNDIGWCYDETSADGYMGSEVKEHNFNLPIGNNVRMVKRKNQKPVGATNKETWTQTEKICVIIYKWAEQEAVHPCLESFDYTDMATAAQQFIDCQPSGVNFTSHVENCFDALVAECEDNTTPEWTKEYFAACYPVNDEM